MRRFPLHIENLETRSLLSSGLATDVAREHTTPASISLTPLPLTLNLDPSSDPAHNGVVYQTRMNVSGQTAPGEIVKIAPATGHHFSLRTKADARGDYHFNLHLGIGQTTLQARAITPTGRQATAGLTVTCGNLVIAWNAAALQAIRTDGTSPPVAARNLAMVQVAVFNAVNAIDPMYQEYHASMTPPTGASPDAAAAQAAHDVLTYLYPKQSSTFDAELAASLAGLHPGRSRAAGIAVGQAAAQQIIAWRNNDGADTKVTYVPGTALGKWQPTPPAFAKALLPQWPQVTPFALVSGSQFRPSNPPALTSSDYAAALNEVERLGSKNSTTRTSEQTQIAFFWSDGAGTSTPPATGTRSPSRWRSNVMAR